MDKNRLLEILEDILMIHSPTRNEIGVCKYIQKFFEILGAQIYLDESQNIYDGNCPTLFVKLEGNVEGEGVTFSSHMDVVEPNKGLKIIKEENIWKSDGKTTLGGDDKAGVAAILYAVEFIIKNKIPHEDIYAIFTPGEEMGMLGARNINWTEVYKHINPAKNMIVVDNAGKADKVAYQAPTCYKFEAVIEGKKAHAGIEPEKGINAIQLASKAISEMKIGRLDKLTTSNVSVISADFPSNVVPDKCVFTGEVRGHEDEAARSVLNKYKSIIEKHAKNCKFNYECEYPTLKSKDNLKFVNEFVKVYEKVGVKAETQIIGGGSDANFFANEGFNSVIIGVGMENVHTTEEYLELQELYNTTEAIIEYIRK